MPWGGRTGSIIALLVASLLFLVTATCTEKPLTGAGATFPYPLYSKWFDEYARVTGVRINYQSIGSGAGIQQILKRTVDFGATDTPMNDEQLEAAWGEILHLPTVLGAVVIIYNLPGVGKGLKLTPEALAGIFLGDITRWNDRRIAELNPELALPDQGITVVHRSDGSGTTFHFVDYLSQVSATWRTKVGKGTMVNWPVGIGQKGNEGVVGQVKQLPGSIGYTELSYAVQTDLPYAFLQNQAGRFVEPTLENITAAAAEKEMPEDLRVSLVNAPGNDAYPIVGYTYLLVYKEQPERFRGEVLVRFLWWAIHQGQRYAPELFYAPLPENVVARVEQKIRSITFQGMPLMESGAEEGF
jgi:phosphate transport system substrate-binding protein